MRRSGPARRTGRGRPRPGPSAPQGERRELVVETMGAQGDGVAAGGVMTALTLPGERVGALVAGDRGELIDVIEPSSERTSPPCPHFGVCGGCSLQHWAHEPYLEWKIEKVRTALARVRLEPEVRLAFAAEPGTRRRVALHARREGRGVRLGFKARRSWSVIPIDVCPISLPVIVDALHVLRELAGPFLATPASAPILHVTATDTGLDIDVTGVERPGPSADALSRVGELAATANISRVTRGGEIAYQARASIVQFGPARVALPPGAFLQAVAQAESAMAAILVDAAQGARGIADLYCGAGAFSFRLAAVAPVLAVDASEAAVAALRSATAAAPGLKGIRTEARDLDRRPMLASELKGFDVVVFDPPRAGAAAQAGELARSQVPRVLAVSCNPGTFARDARTLADGGYELRRVEVVDQFLWSPHVELVGIFQRGA